MTTKICNGCNKEKELSEFNKGSGKFGYRPKCRKCTSEQERLYRKNHPKDHMRARYNLTVGDIEQMFIDQNNLCPICKKELKHDRSTIVEHNHISGKVRGLVHGKCNNILGMADDSILMLQNAIQYLENQEWYPYKFVESRNE